jgi:rare lipoprotein A
MSGIRTASLPICRRIPPYTFGRDTRPAQTHARPREAADQTASRRNEKEDVVKGRIVLFAVVLTVSQLSPTHFTRAAAEEQAGIASIYSIDSGSGTASGEKLNPGALTAAHRSLPFGTKVKVTNKSNGRSVVVTINDRGPFVRGRLIDVTPAAACALDLTD